jgi:hypothetical protein
VPLLRFSKIGRTALITYGSNPVGAALRCEVDGAFTWSRTYRASDELRTEVESLRADLVARGWSEVIDAA